MSDIFIIGDVHGHIQKLKKIVELIEQDAKEIVLVGDLIDRGPNSIDVLEFVIERGFTVVRGNHEEIMKESLLDVKTSSMSLWLDSGGKSTINEYSSHKHGEALLDKHLKYIKNLPYYKTFNEFDEIGRQLIVSHAPIGDFLSKYNLEDMRDDDFLWNQSIPKLESKYFNIFGHNIVSRFVRNKSGGLKIKKELIKDNVIIDKSVGYAAIDSDVEQFKLTAIGFPSMKVFQV